MTALAGTTEALRGFFAWTKSTVIGLPPRTFTYDETASGESTVSFTPRWSVIPVMLSPALMPATAAGEPGTTSEIMRVAPGSIVGPSTTRGMPACKAPANKSHATSAFIATPAMRMIACFHLLAPAKLPAP